MCAFVVLLFEEFSYPYESSLAFCQDKLVLSTAHSLFFLPVVSLAWLAVKSSSLYIFICTLIVFPFSMFSNDYLP